jgi:hypothetical protein
LLIVFCQILVTESIPKREADVTAINSAYPGISFYIKNPKMSKLKQHIHPRIPHTLLELIPPEFFKKIVLQSKFLFSAMNLI